MKLAIFLALAATCVVATYASGSIYCSKPRIPAYGYIRKGSSNRYKVGHVVHFACRLGYRLVGHRSIKCLRRGTREYWNRKSPICKKIVIITRKCPQLSDPRNGDVRLSGTTIGSKATYSCDRGFILRGNSVRRCQSNRRWSGRAPVCIKKVILRCPGLNDPRNGNVRLTGTTIGSRAIYKCDRGFILLGNSVRRCQSNFRWSGRAPVCIKPVPRLCPKLNDPRNGDVELTGTTIGSKATYSCDSGFILIGNSVRKCQSNLQWSGRAPVCKKIIQCQELQDPQNGNVEFNDVSVGSKAVYSCDKGFRLRGNRQRKCQSNGQWSGSQPVCIEIIIDCGNLPNPQDGSVDLSGGTTVGSEATYNCDEGFELEGDQVRTCQSDGQWSGDQPVCNEIDCGPLDNPVNGEVDLSDGTTVGSEAMYACNSGFTLQGQPARKCQANGQWSGDEPTCIAIDCGPLDAPDNGQVQLPTGSSVGSEALYECNRGFNLVGVDSRTCQANGQWSDEEPTCVAIDCGPLDAPDNGQVQLPTGTSVDSEALYECNRGFNLVGVDSRTCQVNGQWSDEEPTCAPIDCGVLSNPSNGQVKFSDTTFGSVATYTCSRGFRLIGSSTRQCEINGQWSNTEPICQKIIIIVQCKKLPPPRYGQVYITGTGIGAIAHYSCYHGYSLIGNSKIVCTAHGNWSPRPPVCVRGIYYKDDHDD